MRELDFSHALPARKCTPRFPTDTQTSRRKQIEGGDIILSLFGEGIRRMAWGRMGVERSERRKVMEVVNFPDCSKSFRTTLWVGEII